MTQLSASIEVVRDGNKLKNVKALMPVWAKKEANGVLLVQIPLLGLETLANNENEIKQRVNELFKAFCRLSESHGLGFETELATLGWLEGKNKHAFSLNAPSAFERVLETGEQNILEAELA
jgi:hypothetical protein